MHNKHDIICCDEIEATEYLEEGKKGEKMQSRNMKKSLCLD